MSSTVAFCALSLSLSVAAISVFPFNQKQVKYESRIVNGIPTVTKQWPWMVSIRLNGTYQKDGTHYNDHICGGSIIRRTKPAAILTAGHCVEWMNRIESKYMTHLNIWIDIGLDDISHDAHNAHSHLMSKYVYHPNITYDAYYQNTAINDIGIIFTESSLPSTQSIISLNRHKTLTDGDELITMGYGWNNWHSEMMTHRLHQTQVTYINDTQCNIAIDRYFTNHWHSSNYTLFLKAIGIEIDNDQYPYNILQCKPCVLCAIGNNSDACNGDSGSPLIKGTNKDALQVGIVSYGFECNIKGVPSQYTDIAFYYDWIQRVLTESLMPDENGGEIYYLFLVLLEKTCHYKKLRTMAAKELEQENIIAYGDKISSIVDEYDAANRASSDAYDSDTSLSSDEKLKKGILMKKKSLMNILKDASKSRYSPMMIHSEVSDSLEDLNHPPNDKKSFIWGAILMFIASFLFSISTQIIKYNHSFGRESFEIFVFRMFIQLFVTTIVASISVAMNHHYCYESVSVLSDVSEFSCSHWDEGNTETEYESNESDIEADAELGQFNESDIDINDLKVIDNYNYCNPCKYKCHKPCFQVRFSCVCTTVFAKFWRESTSSTKWYILARGLCGGTGAVSYYWAVALLPINDTIMIFSLFPVFSTIFAALILKERVSYRQMLALIIAMMGITFMCYPSFIFGNDDRDDKIYNITETEWKSLIQGYGFALIGSICYGFVFVFIRLAYKAPTFSLIYSNGMFGLMEAIIICIIFHRFVPIPMWRDWLLAIFIGFIGYLAQNAENRSGKYMFASLASLIRVTDVFWEYVWQNLIYSKPAGSIATMGAACLAFSIIAVMIDKHNDIKDIEISSAKEGVIDYESEYQTDDINDIYSRKR